jgi:ERCC4-type nuclease
MKQIENIFSKTKTEPKHTCPNPKTPIIIDKRENNSLIKSILIQNKANFSEELLSIGDYLINDTIVERKTYKDFLASLKDKRLFNQIQQMKKYNNQLLILESFDFSYNSNFNSNAIRGTILSIANLIPIIYTENENDTVNFLIQIAKRQTKENKNTSLRETKTALTEQQKKQFILEGFPGIGPTIAQSLLEQFNNSLKQIFNATEEKLQETNKLDKNKTDNFLRLLE